jgi:tetratricopeptide (TPR) repeat protein
MNRKQRRASAKATSAGSPGRPAAAQALFAAAVQSHQAMDIVTAERRYRQVLAIDPRHADSLQFLGVIAAQTGRRQEALTLIGKAVEHRPANAEAHNNLGALLHDLGRHDQAIEAYGKALVLKPGYAHAHCNLGVTLHAAGRSHEALAAYRRAIDLAPSYAEAHNNLGTALRDLMREDEAATAFRRAVALKPDYPDALINHSGALRRAGRAAEALAPGARALELKPGYPEAHVNLGNLLEELGRGEEAIAAYRRAIELNPTFTEAYNALGIAYQELGRASEAIAAVDQALAIEPGSAHAWRIRSGLKSFERGDPDIDSMEALLSTAQGLGLLDRMRLEFALGKAWMDVGDAGHAFAHLNAGNRLRRDSLSYDARADVARIEAIAAAFSPDLMRRYAGLGDPSQLPIFIVGMPRAGTTLIEQILASHPDVHGGGELTQLGALIDEASSFGGVLYGYPQLLSHLTSERLAQLGGAYCEQIASLALGRRRVTDKTPANFLYAGLIHLMAPNGRIIHCRRDPRDTCLSCYTTLFSSGQRFTYDLGELGAYYRSYAGLMDLWRELLPPDRFTEVRYEAVVADLEGEARRLVAFCGLEWDEACLDFHKTERQVRTASANQVRQPLYRGSVGRWERYADHLAPLTAALDGGER